LKDSDRRKDKMYLVRKKDASPARELSPLYHDPLSDDEGRTLDRPEERRQKQQEYIIDKAARQVPFSEDPDSIREGAFPLADPGKTGIPPGARWTKINRMLVNPAALEAAHERYEKRGDYVIVLRVLSGEEIQKLADKTREIRGKMKCVSLMRPDAKFVLTAANEAARQSEKHLGTDG
jgi:hypothetical protein